MSLIQPDARQNGLRSPIGIGGEGENGKKRRGNPNRMETLTGLASGSPHPVADNSFGDHSPIWLIMHEHLHFMAAWLHV